LPPLAWPPALELAEPLFAKGPRFFEIFNSTTATLERILARPLADTVPQLANGGCTQSEGLD
jgi:hypothetical protein